FKKYAPNESNSWFRPWGQGPTAVEQLKQLMLLGIILPLPCCYPRCQHISLPLAMWYSFAHVVLSSCVHMLQIIQVVYILYVMQQHLVFQLCGVATSVQVQ
ncbi:hypothetical protein U1Q18_043623, partial [Sarracenia purpurea var. burkii]